MSNIPLIPYNEKIGATSSELCDYVVLFIPTLDQQHFSNISYIYCNCNIVSFGDSKCILWL